MSPLIGRSAEVSQMRALTGLAREDAGRALVVLGEAGIGKSAVLSHLRSHAAACGLRVLSANGRPRESALPFAGLRQFSVPSWPTCWHQPRRGPGNCSARRLTASGTAGDRDRAGGALLGLLELLASLGEPGQGVVAVIDDAQWIDRASLDLLAFAAYRLDARPVTMILAARGDAPPAGFERGLAELRLGPLTAAEASDLLDAQPCPPRGRARAQVLAQAAGNPLALIELTRTVAGDPAAERTWAGMPLPPTDRLSALGELRATAGSWPSPRVRQLLARAHCVLADPSTPDAYPDDVLGDPAGEQWPFERAQLCLEYGQWLRRHRRINQAKHVLSAAHDAFLGLTSRPWAHQAATELRACGIAVPEAVTSAAGLGALTPQQREIIELAAQGLTNREIAQRLLLSPRTIASHLYRSFPKLGIAGRRQLHSVLAAAD